MGQFQLFARPWWVNLLFFIPFVAYYFFQKRRPVLAKSRLAFLACFGVAFGFMEAATVIYLRVALGFPANSLPLSVQQTRLPEGLSGTLLVIEFVRNLATLVMLLSVTLAAAKKFKERFAVFLWIFAFWDLFYYISLWLAVRWPASLTSPDVLFLVPVPWYAQVWFPLLVSLLSIGVVLFSADAKIGQ